jgi:hypothetical protein
LNADEPHSDRIVGQACKVGVDASECFTLEVLPFLPQLVETHLWMSSAVAPQLVAIVQGCQGYTSG